MTGALASWAALDPAERKARCRAFAALARVFMGPRADALVALLRAAETEPARLQEAELALGALPAILARRAWSVMAHVG